MITDTELIDFVRSYQWDCSGCETRQHFTMALSGCFYGREFNIAELLERMAGLRLVRMTGRDFVQRLGMANGRRRQ